jgi:outer membrane protein assembly factor BamB
MRAKGVRLVGLALGAGLVVTAAVGYKKLDVEHYQSSPERLRTLAGALLPAPPTLPGTGDWPQWRGPGRDGLCTESVALRAEWPREGPPVLWRKTIGRGFSSVAVAGGRLYTMAEEAPPAGPGDTAASPAQEAVLCWDALTGRELWRFRYPGHYEERFGSGPRSTPAVADGLVYAVGPTGIFHCLRADTGKEVWRHDLAEEFHSRPSRYGVSFSPLVDGDRVYAMPGGPNGNAVAAFDRRSGALLWKALDDPIGYSSPVAVTAGGVRQVLFFTNTALVSLSPRDGREFWRHPWETPGGFNIATPLPLGDYVFISSGYGKGCALLEVSAPGSAPRASPVYQHNRMRNHFASSVRHRDHIYGFDRTDLVCMDVRTGRTAWRQRGFRRFQKGSLLIARDLLIILSESGTLYLAEATPEGYRETASCRVSVNKCWTVPVLAGGRLYVRDEGQLTCLDLRR